MIQIPNIKCILKLFTYFSLILNDTKEFPTILRVFYDILVTALLATKNYCITLVRRDI